MANEITREAVDLLRECAKRGPCRLTPETPEGVALLSELESSELIRRSPQHDNRYVLTAKGLRAASCGRKSPMDEIKRDRDGSRLKILGALQVAGDWVTAKAALGTFTTIGPWSEDLQALVEEGVVECNVPACEMGNDSLVRLSRDDLFDMTGTVAREPKGDDDDE